MKYFILFIFTASTLIGTAHFAYGSQIVFEANLKQAIAHGPGIIIKDDSIELTNDKNISKSASKVLFNIPDSLFSNNIYIVKARVAVDTPYESSLPWLAAELSCNDVNHGKNYNRQLKLTNGYEEHSFYVYLTSANKSIQCGIHVPHQVRANIRLNKLWLEKYQSVDESFPYQLATAETDTHITAALETSKPTTTNQYLFSYNTTLPSSKFNYSTPIFQAMFKDFQPGGVRFPGGTFANFYDWRVDTMPHIPDWTHRFVSQSMKHRKANDNVKFGYSDLAELAKNNNSDMIVVLNVDTIPIESIVDWAKDLRKRGLSAKYFELGNETYDKKQISEAYRPVDKYLARAAEITKALKSYDPDIKVGVVAHGPGITMQLSNKWNAEVAKADFYDGIIVHTYNKENGAAFDAVMKRSFLTPEKHVSDFLDHYAKTFGTKKPLWNTEWNVMNLSYTVMNYSEAKTKRPFRFSGPVLSMLHNAGYMLTVLDNSDRFEMTALHAFGPSTDSFGILNYTGDNANTFTLSYLYFAHQMLNQISANSSSHFPVLIDENAAPIDKDFTRVLARGFIGKDGTTRVFLVNKLPVNKTINLFLNNKQLKGFKSHHALSGSSLNEEKSVAVGETLIQNRPISNSLVLPPYSLNIVELQ